jgi:prepilin-type N-terminal cleavage/methylation domain-containing protein
MQEEPTVFTLIELMIMLAIMGILAAIAVPKVIEWHNNWVASKPAEDTRTPEQKVSDEEGVQQVGELKGCPLYRYSNHEGRHYFVVCPHNCPVVKP